MRPGGAEAPALPEAQRVAATGLQTQAALSEHTGHGVLLGNPEGTWAEEGVLRGRSAEQLEQMWREAGQNRAAEQHVLRGMLPLPLPQRGPYLSSG